MTNIVLIHGHDLGRWLSCYGMPSVPSPHIAAFAEESVVFDQAFATAPLCSPARGSLFTGLSPHRHGVMGLAHRGWRYRAGVQTLPEMLGPLGYRTALVGLQHENVDPDTLGFDEVLGSGFLPRALPVADVATRWLTRNGRGDRPFFLTVGMWEVHRPWPAEDYVHADPADVDVPPYLPDNEHTRADIAAFHGAIRQFDQAVGRVLEAVDRHTDSADTMVIFTTDHGAAFPRAKGTLYDPGTEVTLIIRPPTSHNVTPGRRTDPASHLDIVPTALELAGGMSPSACEGESLVPVLTGETSNAERALVFLKTYHDVYDPIRAIRTPDFKLIRNFTDGPALRLPADIEASETRRGMGDAHLAPRPAEELYDLRADPWERTNLAGDERYVGVRDDLRNRLGEWMKQTHDPQFGGDVPPPPPRTREIDALPSLPR